MGVWGELAYGRAFVLVGMDRGLELLWGNLPTVGAFGLDGCAWVPVLPFLEMGECTKSTSLGGVPVPLKTPMFGSDGRTCPRPSRTACIPNGSILVGGRLAVVKRPGDEVSGRNDCAKALANCMWSSSPAGKEEDINGNGCVFELCCCWWWPFVCSVLEEERGACETCPSLVSRNGL